MTSTYERTQDSSVHDYSSEDYEADDKDEDVSNVDLNELCDMLKSLKPYQFEPEEEMTSATDHTSESELESPSLSEPENEKEVKRVGTTDWCNCGKCKEESREIDCLCCSEVSAISEDKFENNICITEAREFKKLCLDTVILKNVLVALHESKGDPLEKETSNRSFRFAAYKQFVWWVFQRLGKGNRRVLPSCVIWQIRGNFPQTDGMYTLYSEGQID